MKNALLHFATFANRKYEELSYPQKSENVRPHSSNSIENENPLESTQSWKCDPIEQHIPISLLRKYPPPCWTKPSNYDPFQDKIFSFWYNVQRWEAVQSRIQNFLGFSDMGWYILSWELINTKNYFNLNHHAGTLTNWYECKPEGSTISLLDNKNRPHVRELKTALDSGLHTMDSGFSV